MLILSSILAVFPLVLPLVLLILVLLVPVAILIYPKLRDSNLIRNLSKQLNEEKDIPETTEEVIDNIETSEKVLGTKKKEQQKFIKQSEKVSEKINKFLDKRRL